MQARQLFYRVLIAGLCLTALVAIVGFLSGDFDETDARVLGTTFALVVYSSTGLAGFSLLSRQRAVALAYAGIASSLLGFLTGMNLIWSDSGFDSDGAWKSAFVFLIVALAAAHTALLVLRQRKTDPPSVEAAVRCTIAAIAVLASMLVIALLKEVEDEGYYRFLGVIAVLWVLGTILVPVVRKAQGSRTVESRDQPHLSTGPPGHD
jgi:hypothetical protein